MVIILMGTTGSGKTTVGRELAQRLGWRFVDGDDFHPAANIAKMSRNQPLDDADRAPWLASLRRAIDGWIANGESIVLACSALKRIYRQQLEAGPEVRIVYLKGSYQLIESRVRLRPHHFARAGLLASQFADLEEPAADEGVITVSVEPPPGGIAAAIVSALGLKAEG
jgi:carbohydrate kinase (thermoresistant glucokinase family)